MESSNLPARLNRLGVTCLLGLLVSAALTEIAHAQLAFARWTVSEFQPDIPNGGRGNTIAVNPANNNIILVASESGGLFRSTDRGLTWTHVASLPEYSMGGVAFVPADPTVVIATTNEDFRTNNGGGIWRSTNGGLSWSHISNPTAPPGVTTRFGAGEISIAPDTGNIFVATVYGVGISTDRGATWRYVRPFPGSPQVFSVLAQSGNHVLAGSFAGVERSSDGGTTWFAATAGPGGVWDMHAFGGSPFSQDQAYVVNGNTNLFHTEDAGDHWTQITAAPAGGGGCGGIGFVKTVGRTLRPLPGRPLIRQLDLYFGNRCGMSKLTCPAIAGTNRFDCSGAWTPLSADHGDTRDLAFDNLRRPLELATDGGLHQTADGGLHWTFTGGGHNGYNALQITEVRGQWIDSIPRHDLYFGTQDNNLYSSGDGGATWTYGTCCEGFFIEGMHHVPTVTDSQISFVACSGCGNFESGALFAGIGGWHNPAGNVAGNPKIVAESFHVQGVDSSGGMSNGLAETVNLGSSWRQYAAFPEDRRDLPKLTRNFFLPVLYQSIRTGWDSTRNFEIDHLARISRRLFPPGVSVTYPAMNNFGGLGVNPTMFAWYQVFGVDPSNGAHIIAPDIVNEKMMQTTDGGNNWTEIPALTSLVTDGGQFMFRDSIFPHASAIGFSLDNPSMVAVGTFQGGIFISGDGGAHWAKVPGSEAVTYITAFEWRSSTDVIVSTYGRGLWRLRWIFYIPWQNFEHYCNLACIILPFPPLPDPPPDPFTDGVLVFDGQIQGVRVAQGMLQEIFVQPGASVAFFSRSEKAPKIKVTETTKKLGFAGTTWAPILSKQTRNLAGFAFAKDGKVAGAVFSEKQLSMRFHAPQESEELRQKVKEQEAGQPEGNEKSPTIGKPYMQMITGHPNQPNVMAPGKTMQLSGREFAPGSEIEIAVDDKVVAKTTVGPDRAVQIAVPVPNQFGMHYWTVRDAATGKVIDGAMFLVSHEDRPPAEGPQKQPTPRPQPKP